MHWAKFWREIRLCNKGTQIIHPFDSWPSNLIIKSQIQIKSGRIILTLLESHHAGSQIKVRQEGDYKQISLTCLHPCSYYSFIQRPQQRARRPEHHVGGLQLQIRQGQYLLGQDQWELSDVNTVFLHPGGKKKKKQQMEPIYHSVSHFREFSKPTGIAWNRKAGTLNRKSIFKHGSQEWFPAIVQLLSIKYLVLLTYSNKQILSAYWEHISCISFQEYLNKFLKNICVLSTVECEMKSERVTSKQGKNTLKSQTFS